MKSPARRLLPRLCAVPLSLLLWAPGCAKQGEGERCDYNRNGHQDCETGLVCVPAADLIDDSTDRCCPPEGQTISNDHCLRSGGVGGTGGGGGTGGKDGGTGGTDSGTGGAAGSGGTGGAAGGGGAAGSDSGSDSASGGAAGSDSGSDSASGGTTSDAGTD